MLFFKENVDPLSKDLAFLLGDKEGVGENVAENWKYFRILCEDGGVAVVEPVHQAALARQHGSTASRPRPLR